MGPPSKTTEAPPARPHADGKAEMTRRVLALLGSLTCLSLLSPGLTWFPAATARGQIVSEDLRQRAQRDGQVRVLLELKLSSGPGVPEGSFANPADIAVQRREIARTQLRLLSNLR